MTPRRRLLTLALAAFTAVLASGAPLPFVWLASLSPAVIGEQRYPCEGSACGCSTASQCWKKCCCHSLAERLEWARREGVRPPAAALDRAESRRLDVSPWRKGRRYFVEPPVADSRVANLPPCCAAKRSCQPTESSEERAESPGVSLAQALACQGLVEAWLQLGTAPIPSPVCLMADRPVLFSGDTPRIVYREPASPPIPPPPESAASRFV